MTRATRNIQPKRPFSVRREHFGAITVWLEAQDDLYKTLKGKVADVRLVGDAMAPRRIHDAILEGTRAGRAV